MVTLSQQTNADLVRLQHATDLELSQTLKALLDRGEALVQTAEIVERRFDDGSYFLNDQLASLVAHTKSAPLYLKARQQLCRDDWALLTLYQGQYPDPAIEKTLCVRLYQTASDDAEPRRRYIVDAMRDVGSDDVLPTLEAILFDHASTLKAKQVIAQAIDSVDSFSGDALLSAFEVKSRTTFLMAVAEAIVAIKNRDNRLWKTPFRTARG